MFINIDKLSSYHIGTLYDFTEYCNKALSNPKFSDDFKAWIFEFRLKPILEQLNIKKEKAKVK